MILLDSPPWDQSCWGSRDLRRISIVCRHQIPPESRLSQLSKQVWEHENCDHHSSSCSACQPCYRPNKLLWLWFILKAPRALFPLKSNFQKERRAPIWKSLIDCDVHLVWKVGMCVNQILGCLPSDFSLHTPNHMHTRTHTHRCLKIVSTQDMLINPLKHLFTSNCEKVYCGSSKWKCWC